jgi:hypothetical protein
MGISQIWYIKNGAKGAGIFSGDRFSIIATAENMIIAAIALESNFSVSPLSSFYQTCVII